MSTLGNEGDYRLSRHVRLKISNHVAGQRQQVDQAGKTLTFYFVLSVFLAQETATINDHNNSFQPW